MADEISQGGRTNVYIHAAPDEFRIRRGAEEETYRDPHEARAENEFFAKAYRRLLEGASAIRNHRFEVADTCALTPDCRAVSGRFVMDGKETQLAVFTKWLEDTEKEGIRAIQLMFRDENGQYVDFYSTDPRQHRLFDSLLASTLTFVA